MRVRCMMRAPPSALLPADASSSPAAAISPSRTEGVAGLSLLSLMGARTGEDATHEPQAGLGVDRTGRIGHWHARPTVRVGLLGDQGRDLHRHPAIDRRWV